MVCLQSENSSSWAKEAPSQFECRALKSSNEWAVEKIGFGRQAKEEEKKIDMKSVQEENHYPDREVTTW